MSGRQWRWGVLFVDVGMTGVGHILDDIANLELQRRRDAHHPPHEPTASVVAGAKTRLAPQR